MINKNSFLIVLIIGIILIILTNKPQIASAKQSTEPQYYCSGSNYCVTYYPTPSINANSVNPTSYDMSYPTSYDSAYPTSYDLYPSSYPSSSVASVTTDTTAPTPCIQMVNGPVQHHGWWRRGRGRGYGDDNNALMQIVMILLNWLMQLMGINTSSTIGAGICPTTTDGTTIGTTTGTTTTDTTGALYTPTPTIIGALAPTPVTSTTGTTTGTPTTVANVRQGNNWAGYYYSVPSSSNASISTQYTIGNATCTNNGLGAPWIGFGGVDNVSDIAQLGVAYDCSTGTIAYKPWTEAYPAAPIYYNDKNAKSGDVITSVVTYTGNNSYTTDMKNTTQGWEINVPMSLSNAMGYGDFIFETSGGKTPDSFGTVNFTNSLFSNSSTTPNTNMGSAPSLVRCEIVQNGTTYTNTSAINGNGFTIQSTK